MSNRVLLFDDIGYLPGIKATVKMHDSRKSGAGAQPTSVPIERYPAGPFYAMWGTDNMFPQNVVLDVQGNPTASRALSAKIAAIWGNGLFYFRRTWDDDGKEIIKPFKDPEIDQFFRQSAIKKTYLHMITNHVYFYNAFPEVILTRNRKKIYSIGSNHATQCRWARMDPDKMKILQCYVANTWPTYQEGYGAVLPVLDFDNPLMDLQTRTDDAYKYILPLYYPTPGQYYYQMAPWNAAREAGWFDIAAKIPKMKNALLDNQFDIKYHIEIPYDYWQNKYKGKWDTWSPEDQQAAKIKELQEMNDMLKGVPNAAKTFISHYGVDPITKNPVAGWKITPIPNNLKDAAWLTDTQQANSETITAVGLDPTLFGMITPAGLGAGSGSDKREALDLLNFFISSERAILLEPLELVRDYNGWDPTIEFGFRNFQLTTLDKNPTGGQNVKAA